jgi:predicted NBD/HSP70 family sugar kinase
VENTSKGAIIRELIRYGALSRPEIAERTGLSRSVITLSTIELMREGIVQKVGTGNSTGGRRPDEFRLGGGNHLMIGIALEDDISIVSLYTLDGHRVDGDSEPFDPRLDHLGLIGMMTRQIERLREGHPDRSFLGVGLALPSIADAETDLVTSMTLQVPGVPLRKLLQEATRLPGNVLDNAHAAALGELWIRGRELRENLLYLYAGRGVGGAIVQGRELYLGRNHSAGEFGRFLVGGLDTDGRPFYGQLETLVSQVALCDWMNTRRADFPTSRLPHLAPDATFIPRVGAAAAGGDSLAIRTIRQAATYVAAASANMINSLNPDEIIVGGPMSAWGDAFIRDVHELAEQWTVPVPYASVRILGAGPRHETIPLGAAATMIRRAPELLARR